MNPSDFFVDPKKLLYSPFIIINNTKTPNFTFLGVKSGA